MNKKIEERDCEKPVQVDWKYEYERLEEKVFRLEQQNTELKEAIVSLSAVIDTEKYLHKIGE